MDSFAITTTLRFLGQNCSKRNRQIGKRLTNSLLVNKPTRTGVSRSALYSEDSLRVVGSRMILKRRYVSLPFSNCETKKVVSHSPVSCNVVSSYSTPINRVSHSKFLLEKYPVLRNSDRIPYKRMLQECDTSAMLLRDAKSASTATSSVHSGEAEILRRRNVARREAKKERTFLLCVREIVGCKSIRSGKSET